MRWNRLIPDNFSRSFLRVCESPLLAGGLALLVYSALALFNGAIWRETQYNYFAYLADAFLHGQFHLRLIPPDLHDLVYFREQYFLYWPPFPAVLLMPLVWLFGVHVSDVLVVLVLSAFNVMLVAQLLRQANATGVAPLDEQRRALIVLFFAFGSVLFPLALFGQVWEMAQAICFMAVVLAYLAALSLRASRAFFFTGLCLGCALITRNHTVFNGIWLAYFLLYSHWKIGTKKLILYSMLGLLPVLLAGAFLAYYNFARFGSLTDVGLDYHKMAALFVENYKNYGAFNLYYLSTNFYYQYINYPFPWRADSFMGGSLFLLSPILFSIFAGASRKESRVSRIFLYLSALVVSIPILLLMGTGWVQFGPRYTLDFTVPLILLVAMGIRRWQLSTISLLVAVSCIHYLLGTVIKIFLLD